MSRPIDSSTEIDRRRRTTRRTVLAGGAWALGSAAFPFAAIPIRARDHQKLPGGPWGGLAELADNAWAVASTPLAHRDFKTVCNGGIVAGTDRVLVVEAFAGRAGAQWVAEVAQELTGRRPTDVVITHYHGDHSGGITGFIEGDSRPTLHATPATLGLISDDGEPSTPEQREKASIIESASRLSPDSPTELDLGGISVVLHPYGGHTASDVTVELPALDLGFGGDLVWAGMIPNFVDARPERLQKTLHAMRDGGTSRYVPGHGSLGNLDSLGRNIELLAIFGEAAERSLQAGKDAATAAAELSLPTPFDRWIAFSPNYVERAVAAWQADLRN